MKWKEMHQGVGYNFTGVVESIDDGNGCDGGEKKTILLKNIRSGSDWLAAEIRFFYGKRMRQSGCKPGDEITFDARAGKLSNGGHNLRWYKNIRVLTPPHNPIDEL